VLEPRENPALIGHAAAEAEMLEAMRGGRMHHAWLITGTAGVGKATLAYRFARRLFAGLPAADSLALDPRDPVFRRVALGSHADLLSIQRGMNEKTGKLRTAIVVDDAREVAGFLRRTPAEGGWRVVVVDGAENLNRNAANAVLKVLEEPPSRAILLLTCAAPGRLLPTIRSRCRRLRLDILGLDDMNRLLGDMLPDTDPGERAQLAALAGGSPGRAMVLADEKGLALAALVDEVLGGIPKIDLGRTLDIADRVGGRGSAENFSTFMTMLCDGLSKIVRFAARGAPQPLTAQRPLVEWTDLWHVLTRIQDETERLNLDKRQAIISSITLLNGS
jgi:DNA polymerase-3 subunit delta'